MNLEDSSACKIADAPKTPVIFQYLGDQKVAAVCGQQGNKTDQSCYSLSNGTNPGWTALPQISNQYCPFPSQTRSHYINNNGWFVLGKKPLDRVPNGNFDTCRYQDSKPSAEIFNTIRQWNNISIASPYRTGNYPQMTCSVPLNTSHVMVMGGYSDGLTHSEAFIYNIASNTWTNNTAAMPQSTQWPGCVLKPDGEVLVAGGMEPLNGIPRDSVHIYNVASNSWRTLLSKLPEPVRRPVMLLWKNTPILLVSGTDKVYKMKDDNSWELLEAKLGKEFRGDTDLAVVVPSGLYSCP